MSLSKFDSWKSSGPAVLVEQSHGILSTPIRKKAGIIVGKQCRIVTTTT